MEPERRIEKWLRAFAKKRREQAGDSMELRPATRERLQREVTRLAEEKNRGWFANLFFGLRPALAFAVCFVALAVVGGILLVNSNRQQPANTLSMAKLSERKFAPKKEEPTIGTPPISMNAPVSVEEKKALADKQSEIPTAPPPAPTVAAPTVIAGANPESIAAPTEAARERDRDASNLARRESSVTTKTLSMSPSTNLYAFKNKTTADSIATAGELNKDAASAAPALAPQSQGLAGTAQTLVANDQTRQQAVVPQPPAAPAASGAFFDSAKATPAATPPQATQLFNRIDMPATRQRAAGGRAVGAVSVPPPVLASFRVEKNGNTIKVIDADGSVYTGSVQMVEASDGFVTPGTLKSAPSAAKIPEGHALVPTVQNYFFRVAGTNRTQNQNIVFSGNFVPLTNTQFATGGRAFGGAGGGGVGVAQPNANVETLLNTSRITGKAVIGNQKEIEVNATPAR